MKYRIGRQGRVILARFEENDDVLGGIIEIARSEDVRAAVFFLVGGMKEGRFVVGPREEKLPPVPVWREMNESHETLGTGTVFWDGETPKIHFHGVFAKGDLVRAGCLRENAKTFLVLEAIIMEIEGTGAVRKPDPETGLSLLDFLT